MRWLLIIRPLVNKRGIGFIEGNASIAPVSIEAPDRAAAEAQMPLESPLARYAVVAECSWKQMSPAERLGLLAGAEVPQGMTV